MQRVSSIYERYQQSFAVLRIIFIRANIKYIIQYAIYTQHVTQNRNKINKKFKNSAANYQNDAF